MRKTIFFSIILLVMFSSIPRIQALEDYKYSGLSLKLYADGVAHVDYRVDVNPVLARLNVTILGRHVTNLIVKDQDGDLLGSTAPDGYILVNVLGSKSISIEYITPDLTAKEGAVWTLQAFLPIESDIQLPEGATILFLDPIPIGISVVGASTTLTMPSGNASLSYMIGVIGTREHSLALINDAEETINELAKGGIIVDEAIESLENAWNSYRDELYSNAEEYAQQAKSKAVETGQAASDALSAMDSVRAAIETAKGVGRTSRLNEANAKLDQAQLAYDVGNYADALSLAEEALTHVQQSKAPSPFTTQNMIIIALGLTSVVAVFITWRRTSKPPQEDMEVDTYIESIIEDHPLLRLEEKEVLRYIADAGEGIFLSELRERFDLPRSTAWRMVRRLEEMGVLQTETVGRETFIRISTGRDDVEQVREPE
ncbi:MAG: helix-turn-helix domain-containing protein [Candidatus Bathyarchaeota archaeon]|jgi:uncharacterized membrane protein|nr:helix-turn-helix domain-containing protein [Candidatus Bathyarchaeota archaeon]